MKVFNIYRGGIYRCQHVASCRANAQRWCDAFLPGSTAIYSHDIR